MEPDFDSPELVVQRQIDAYNAKDLEALMLIYAADAEYFDFPSTLLAKGTRQFRERYGDRFTEPNLKAVITNRVVMGPMVIDHELVNRTFPEGPGTAEFVMIYQVERGRIRRVWQIPGTRTILPG